MCFPLLATILAHYQSFQRLTAYFRASTFIFEPPLSPTLLSHPFFRFFNFYHAFLCAFNYCQLFSSPTTCPHTSITSPSRFRDKPLTFEPVHSFLTPNHQGGVGIIIPDRGSVGWFSS